MQPETARKPDAAELARRSIMRIPDHVFSSIVNSIVAAGVLLAVVVGLSMLWHMPH